MDAIGEPLPLTEAQVKCALQKSIGARLPETKKGLEGIDMNNLSTESVFVYKLESLVETRIVEKKIEPYDGSPIDGCENGPVPDVWDAPVIPPSNFVEGEVMYLVPHSEEVYVCTSCEGEGKIYCPKCHGYGRRLPAKLVTDHKSVMPGKPYVILFRSGCNIKQFCILLLQVLQLHNERTNQVQELQRCWIFQIQSSNDCFMVTDPPL